MTSRWNTVRRARRVSEPDIPAKGSDGLRWRPGAPLPFSAVPALDDQVPLAVVGERLCTDLVDVTDDPACLDAGGFWAVVVPYDGRPTFARFATVRPAAFLPPLGRGRLRPSSEVWWGGEDSNLRRRWADRFTVCCI